MSAKTMLIDFINLVFTIAIIICTIIYFTTGDNFENFKRLMESLVPFAILILIFMVNWRLWRQTARKRESEGNMGITLEMTYMDKLKGDLVVFTLPAAVLLIAFLSDKHVGATAVLEAVAVFVIAYLWQKWLFGKEA
jgi:hypothetical protein